MPAHKPTLEYSASSTPQGSTNMPRKLHAPANSGFGARLAQLRKAAGITQTALAAEIAVS
jgi:hypothetical protein